MANKEKDYEKMYHELCEFTDDALELGMRAQQALEELFAGAADGPLHSFPPEEDEEEPCQP